MKPIDVLAMFAAGQIPTTDIERSKDLWGVRYDESLKANFLVFKDGNILKVDTAKYDYMIALFEIMNPDRKLWNIKSDFSGVGKVLKHIHEKTKSS